MTFSTLLFLISESASQTKEPVFTFQFAILLASIDLLNGSSTSFPTVTSVALVFSVASAPINKSALCNPKFERPSIGFVFPNVST